MRKTADLTFLYPTYGDGQNTQQIWSIIERKMRNIRGINAEKLNATFKATWDSITPKIC